MTDMKTYFFIIITCCFFFVSCIKNNEPSTIDVYWDYPIKPGMEEWENLESHKAKVDACQVPDDILQNISTKELLKLCLNYPLLYDVFSFNDINLA